ncbi:MULTISPECIES: hypothetical protein [unclassified Yoonia]|uniref:hypothetical protein n=1 Tax=unclassified Yoonia TaxID=2629118 RepID=UPI002B000870|nr:MULTISPECIES: hypothetical protein [unclassified Yoonia]
MRLLTAFVSALAAGKPAAAAARGFGKDACFLSTLRQDCLHLQRMQAQHRGGRRQC